MKLTPTLFGEYKQRRPKDVAINAMQTYGSHLRPARKTTTGQNR